MKRTVMMLLVGFALAALSAYVPVDNAAKLAWTTRIENFVSHTCQNGDTLEKLAKIYGTTIIRIVSRNKLETNPTLKEGQKLVIPVSGYKEKLII